MASSAVTSIPIPPPPGTNLAADRYSEIVIADCITYFFVLVAVTLRFVSRKFSGAGFWIDDYLVVPALICSTGQFLVQFIYQNWGKHVWAVGLPEQGQQIKILFAMEFFYLFGLTNLKCSVLAFYYRIFGVSALRYFIYIMLFIVLGWALAVCVPLSKLWNIFEPGYCNLSPGYLFGSAFAHIFIDAILLLMPIPVVWKLQVPRFQKLLIIGTFMMGGFVIAISCVRLYYVWSVDLSSIDMTWNLTDTVLWSVIELHTAVIAVCAPTLRPMYRWVSTGSFRLSSEDDTEEEATGSSETASSARRGRNWLEKPLPMLPFGSLSLTGCNNSLLRLEEGSVSKDPKAKEEEVAEVSSQEKE